MRITYITGRYGQHLRGLGQYLRENSQDFDGVSIDSEFLKRSFDEQVTSIQSLLGYAHPQSIIANSYGGYLLVHALIGQSNFEGKVLLLSPVLGKAISESTKSFSRPPRARKLLQALEQGLIPKPRYIEIHTGQLDHSCCPELATQFANLLPADKFQIIPDQGHMITPSIVQNIVNDFVGNGQTA
jgi:alpha-beta hydrolase superfamily lysophospholipase